MEKGLHRALEQTGLREEHNAQYLVSVNEALIKNHPPHIVFHIISELSLLCSVILNFRVTFQAYTILLNSSKLSFLYYKSYLHYSLLSRYIELSS